MHPFHEVTGNKFTESIQSAASYQLTLNELIKTSTNL